MSVPSIVFVGSGEKGRGPDDAVAPQSYRWAVFDRPTRTLYVGSPEIHTHMGVAELSGVLRNPPEYYKPKGNILGGYLCRNAAGAFFYDPYSGTFPGSEEGVREAEASLEEICRDANLAFTLFRDVRQRIVRDEGGRP